MEYSNKVGFSALLKCALQDLKEGIDHHHLWLALAMEDVLDTYRHTSIGVLWAVFSFSFFALSIILVFGLNGGAPSAAYTAHMVTGLLAWNFLSSIITQAPTVFIANERYIKGSRLPLSLFAFHVTIRALLLNGFAAIGASVFLLWNGYPYTWVAFAIVPAILMYVVTAIPVQLLLGSLGAFTRDVQQIIENIVRAVFFLTPVIWFSEPGTHRGVIASLNPLTHYIEIFRKPIVEGVIPWGDWGACVIMTVALLGLSLLIFSYTRRKIVFWI
ncbi:ABC transporter permease [Brucella pituitosa]|uniref:ABC transporter permease n=1 Tax=Brucella pituitosa TaxID=571256 RepID=UPI003F4ACBF7